MPQTRLKNSILAAWVLALLGIAWSRAYAGRDEVPRSMPRHGKPLVPTTPTPQSASSKIVLSLQWEGRDLLDHNLIAIAELRAQFPDIPMIHFISPAYFLRSPSEALSARQKIRSVMRSQDQIGLALGGWKSLVGAAGAIFRNGPTFWGYALRPNDCAWDCGQDIPVHIYPEEELDKIMTQAVKTLEEHGFGRPRGLAVTGWMASPTVLEAATRVGISHDFSAVPNEPLKPLIGSYPLQAWVQGLWPKSTPTFRSFKIPTQTSSILEIPQSLPPIDYVTVAAALKVLTDFNAPVKDPQDASQGERVFQIVFHQETAQTMAPRLFKLLTTLEGLKQQDQSKLSALHIPEMAVPHDQGVGPLVH